MLCPHQEHDRNTILYFLLHQWEEPGKGMWLDDNFVSERTNSNNVDPLVNVFGQIYLTVKYI